MELVIILLVLVMLFGATRLADIGGSLGKGIREFKKNVKDDEEDVPAEAPSTAPAQSVTSNGGEAVAAVKCANCGTLNPMGAKHCTECGVSLIAPVS
jgi:sec-independent protein translocase protein TatA